MRTLLVLVDPGAGGVSAFTHRVNLKLWLNKYVDPSVTYPIIPYSFLKPCK
jgi:hypothetical protein